MDGKVFVLEPDLLFSSKIESAINRCGFEARVTQTINELQGAFQDSVPKAVLVNLDIFEAAIQVLVALSHQRCKLIGYYSHVDSKLGVNAVAAGFDQVMPRRSIMVKLNEVLLKSS